MKLNDSIRWRLTILLCVVTVACLLLLAARPKSHFTPHPVVLAAANVDDPYARWNIPHPWQPTRTVKLDSGESCPIDAGQFSPPYAVHLGEGSAAADRTRPLQVIDALWTFAGADIKTYLSFMDEHARAALEEKNKARHGALFNSAANGLVAPSPNDLKIYLSHWVSLERAGRVYLILCGEHVYQGAHSPPMTITLVRGDDGGWKQSFDLDGTRLQLLAGLTPHHKIVSSARSGQSLSAEPAEAFYKQPLTGTDREIARFSAQLLQTIAVGDDPAVRETELARLAQPQWIALLAGTLQDAEGGSPARAAVVHALVRIGTPEALNPALHTVSLTRDETLVNELRNALDQLTNPRALPVLLEYLGDDRLGMVCALAAGRLPGSAPLKGLLTAYEKASSEAVREAAARGVASTRSSAAMPDLVRVATAWPDERIARAALYGLRNVGGLPALEAMLKLAAEPVVTAFDNHQAALHETLAQTALVASEQDSASVETVLSEALASPLASVRSAALDALVELKNSPKWYSAGKAGPAVQALADRDPELKSKATAALKLWDGAKR